MLRRLFLVAFTLVICVEVMAETWSLPKIVGDKTKKWAAEPNWTWDKGNPMTARGAKWSAVMQKDDNASLTSNYLLMQKGDVYNFVFGWRGEEGGKDPYFKYLKNTLSTHITKGVKTGPAAGIIFTPSEAGKYSVDIAGSVYLQNKSAGYVVVTVYVLSNDRKNAKQLKSYDLNSKGGYNSSKLPDAFSFKQDVSLGSGEELAIRVQSCNPGPASAGKSAVRLKHFNVSN